MTDTTTTDLPAGAYLAANPDADSLLDPTLNGLLPAVLGHLEANHLRSQQHYPGHSSVGRCRRQAGYGYAGTPVDEDWVATPSIQAWIGTAVHSEFLPVLRRLLHPARIELATTWRPSLGTLVAADVGVEQSLDLLPPLTGHVDLYRRRSMLALDLKTVSRHQLDYVRREGARLGDLLQVHANAASLNAEGKPVTHVALLYVCTETSADRHDDEGLLLVQPVDPDLTRRAVEWWDEVTGTVDDLGDVDLLPRDERGPGLSWKCDGCPWLKACWGPTAVPGQVGAQAVDHTVENDAVVSALAMLTDAQGRYTDAGREQRAADADKKFAASILAGTPEGAYRSPGGKTYSLTWKKGQRRMDQQAVKEILTQLNVGVPMSTGADSPVAAEVTA